MTLARLVAPALLLAAPTFASPPYTITAIDLPLGSTGAVIAGINNNGIVAAYATNAQSNYANFLFTPGLGTSSVTGFGRPAFTLDFAGRVAAINDSGQVLTHSGLLFQPQSGTIDLAPAVTAAFVPEIPDFRSLNNKGQVSGQSLSFESSSMRSSSHGFRYLPGGAVETAATGDRRSLSRAPFTMNDAGYVVYSPGFPPGGHIYLYAPDGSTLPLNCGNGGGYTIAMNNAGQVAGNWGRGVLCSFNGVITELGDVNYPFVTVIALNDRNDVLATAFDARANLSILALIQGGKVIDINSLLPANSGWIMNSADHINNTGQIAGIGTHNGTLQGFVLTPVNVPGPIPHIDSVQPTSAPPGTGLLTLTINGANFGPNATVQFGADNLVPTSRTASKLTVLVPPTSFVSPHTANLTVNGVSNVVPFPIATPSATISTTASTTATFFPVESLRSLTAADFNGDGNLDVVVMSGCCSGTTLQILLGDGAGGLTPGSSVPGVASFTSLAIGDFNEDGKTDIATTASESGTLLILTGDGAGHFQPNRLPLGSDLSPGLQIIIAADFNADGHLDLVLGGEPFDTLLLLGNGAGSFTTGTLVYPHGELAGSIVAGDFNGDGKLDLVLANRRSRTVAILLGDGAGGFTPSTMPLLLSTDSLVAGDWNGDGKLDLALRQDSSIEILLGTGTGQFIFASNAVTGPNPGSPLVGDINNDGRLDLATVSTRQASPFGGGLATLLGTGTGSFTNVANTSSGSPFEGTSLGGLALGDFNGDGRLDFVLGSFPQVAGDPGGSISVWLQTPSSSAATSYSLTDVCAPRTCTPTLLGDSGVVAGMNFVVYPETGYIDLAQATGNYFGPRAVNRAGVLVGSAGPPPSHAAAWLPDASAPLNLDTIFGWTSGIASWINNHNEIVGYPGDGAPIPDLIPGVALRYVYALTDTGIVLGEDSSGPVAYRPGSQPVHLPGVQLQSAFNSAGQVLVTWPFLGRLFTPGLGYTNQPSQPGFSVIAFNDAGQFVGIAQFTPFSTPGAALYSEATGLLPIADLLPASSGWTINRAVGVNSAGQILLLATKEARTTAILLSPVGGAAPRLQTRLSGALLSCQSLLFNNAPVCSPSSSSREARPALTPVKQPRLQ